jgi:glycerol-3-phosphate acyltransferase PlsY
MTAVAMFPILLVTLFKSPAVWLTVFSIVVAAGVIATHVKNIKRLIKGEEKRFIRRK